MQIRYKIIIVMAMVIVVLFTFSCDDKSTISPYNDNLLQVNCILNAGHLAFLYIYKPGTIDSVINRTDWYKDTTNAFQVILFKDGIRVDSLKPTTSQEGDYDYDVSAKHYNGLSHIIQSGASYRIEIKKKGYPFIYAECSVPHLVKILLIDTINAYTVDYPGFSGSYSNKYYYYYKVSFIDPPDEKNYYLLEGQEKNINGPYHFEKDPIFENNKKDIYSIAFFSDQLINGQAYTLMAKPSMRGGYGGVDIRSPSEVYISLVSASKEYYSRVKSEYQYVESINDNYAEPVQLYNNIHNGLGIFAGIAKSTDTIRIK